MVQQPLSPQVLRTRRRDSKGRDRHVLQHRLVPEYPPLCMQRYRDDSRDIAKECTAHDASFIGHDSDPPPILAATPSREAKQHIRSKRHVLAQALKSTLTNLDRGAGLQPVQAYQRMGRWSLDREG